MADRLARLTIRQILTWADAHRKRVGHWPVRTSGRVRGTAAETWREIDAVLQYGGRGLNGGSSLIDLLTRYRDLERRMDRPPLRVKQILVWADAHHKRTGGWPMVRSGPVHGVPGENWRKVDNALSIGLRGLPGGLSLPKLLSRYRGTRNHRDVPLLTIGKILSWADAHHKVTGAWPKATSGPIEAAPGEVWSGVNAALYQGTRGLAGGSSLRRFLSERRGARNRKDLPRLTIKQILAWADRHAKRTGKPPRRYSGPVPGVPGETWNAVDNALIRGTRGLAGGSSLSQLLRKRRR